MCGFEKNIHSMTPSVVHENNTHAMTLVDPCVVCGKNRHAMTLAVVHENNRHAMTLVDPYVWFMKRIDMQ